MGRKVHFLGSNWTDSDTRKPTLTALHDAPNLGDPQTTDPDYSNMFYPADFTADMIRKWLYRVLALRVEASGTISRTSGATTYTHTLSVSAEVGPGDYYGAGPNTDEGDLFTATQVFWGDGYNGGPGPTIVGTMHTTSTTGGVTTSWDNDVSFLCGFVTSDEEGGPRWTSSDGENFRHRFWVIFTTESNQQGSGPNVHTYDLIPTLGLTNLPSVGSMSFDGVSIALYSPVAAGATGTISATITPIEFWPYGPEDEGATSRSGVEITSDDWSNP